MTQMTVDEILTLVSMQEHATYYYEFLDFFYGNKPLRNPLNQDEHVYYPRGREKGKHLKGDELVSGEYLVFEECGHDYFAGIYQYDSLLEIEAHIVGGGSYTNGFTDNTCVIVRGNLKPFVVKGCDQNGNEITHAKGLNDDLFELQLTDKWVEWLDEK